MATWGVELGSWQSRLGLVNDTDRNKKPGIKIGEHIIGCGFVVREASMKTWHVSLEISDDAS